jgi:hypothetical protein
LKHVSRDCGETERRTRVVERGGQPVEDSNEPDHTNHIKERRRSFVKLAAGLLSTTTMGDSPISTKALSATAQWVPPGESI